MLHTHSIEVQLFQVEILHIGFSGVPHLAISRGKIGEALYKFVEYLVRRVGSSCKYQLY
jgi:hypothetical protein